jgi:hypothetical protein
MQFRLRQQPWIQRLSRPRNPTDLPNTLKSSDIESIQLFVIDAARNASKQLKSSTGNRAV